MNSLMYAQKIKILYNNVQDMINSFILSLLKKKATLKSVHTCLLQVSRTIFDNIPKI